MVLEAASCCSILGSVHDFSCLTGPSVWVVFCRDLLDFVERSWVVSGLHQPRRVPRSTRARAGLTAREHHRATLHPAFGVGASA